MPKPTTFVLFNPVAGTSNPQEVEEKLQMTLEKAGLTYKIHRTQKDEDLEAVVKEALEAGFEQFIAAGGDGTASTVANALAGTGIPTIIVPTGTQNSLSKIFGIPLELDQAVAWWTGPTRLRKADAMQIDGRYFLLNVSAGLSSEAIKNVGREEKRRLGLLAYILRGFEGLARPSVHRFHFDIDGRKFVHCKAKELLVANTGVLQVKDLPASPDFSIDNGKISVCYFKIRTIWDFIWFALRTILGRQRKPPELICADVLEEISIRTDRPIPVQADGDVIGTTPVTIRLAPGAIPLLAPANLPAAD